MIVVSDLVRRFGHVTAVDGLGFEVRPGEVLGFLGPNGAGKTTTMKVITGFLAPTSGRVTVFGEDVQKSPIACKARIGYLPEGAPLYGDMSPRQLLTFCARVRALPAARARERIDAVVDRLGLGSVVDQRVETLSKGFRRRVGIAQAILHEPDAIILDEPTDGLDPNQKHEVRELIRELARERIIIVSTHILEEVDAVCTRAIIIGAGRLLADGTPEELARRSRYHGAVTMTLREPPQDLEVLASIDGASGMERSDDGSRTHVTVFATGTPRQDGRSLFEVVRQLSMERRWALDGLYVEHGRLDEVFRTLTQGAARREVAA
jgi:ABC-2 type transport system ATP-binding protein